MFWAGTKNDGNSKWNYTVCEFPLADQQLLPAIGNNAFLNLIGDGSANLFVTSVQDQKQFFEIWQVVAASIPFFIYIVLSRVK